MAPHSSTLAWKIPWTDEPGGLQSMGSLRVRHNWATSLSLFTLMHWRRKWQPTPVFLPGESQRWGSPVGCRLWGRTIGHDWSNLAAVAYHSCWGSLQFWDWGEERQWSKFNSRNMNAMERAEWLGKVTTTAGKHATVWFMLNSRWVRVVRWHGIKQQQSHTEKWRDTGHMAFIVRVTQTRGSGRVWWTRHKSMQGESWPICLGLQIFQRNM